MIEVRAKFYIAYYAYLIILFYVMRTRRECTCMKNNEEMCALALTV